MLLFGKRAPAPVTLCGSSCPATDPSVPVASIPVATGDRDAPRSLTTVEDNVSRAIPITTRGLEILRCADGQTSLETIAAAMGTPWEPAHGDLLRLLHADLLRVSS